MNRTLAAGISGLLDVQRCIETFASRGGYILTSANHMQADTPPESIRQMFERARNHGKY